MMKKVGLEDLIVRQEGFPYFSRELLKKRQLELLNAQLHRAKLVSSFYADYPDGLESLDDLKTLSFITAETLKNNFSKLCLLSPDELARLRTERTSGTSGTPKRVAYSQYDCERILDFFENGLGELIYPGDTVLICMQYSDSLSLGGLIAQAVSRLGAVPVCAGSGKAFSEYIGISKEKGCNIYIGPPVLLLSLLRLMDEKDRFARALVSGDHLCDSVKDQCENLMHSRLFPHYGLRESGLGCALTCSAHEGLHVRENDVICEIINENGEAVPDGQWGELVITTIGLDAMPLFRYRTGDFARILPGVCPCGSEVIRIEVTERMDKGISMGYYENILFDHSEIIDFSITGNTVTISALAVSEELKTSVQKLLRGFDIQYRIASLSDTPMYPDKRRIISNSERK